MNHFETVDDFIKAFPKDVQAKLQKLRQIIYKTVPEAGEKIAYGIPTFTFHGNLVHFSAYENHIGFYPGAAPIAEFAKELNIYKTGKGTVQFPLDKPLPTNLIIKMIMSAKQRNLARIKS